MPHFFIENDEKINNSTIVIKNSANYHHIARSLRARTGEKLLLIDSNQIEYETIITNITSSEIECQIKNSYKSERDLNFDLFLAQSPLRSDSQLTVMEKSTELGIRAVYPVITDNCAVAFDTAKKKQEKWQRIMFEASKQCERATIPVCYEPDLLENVIKKNFDRIIVFGERSTEISLKSYLKKTPIKDREKLLIIIGPEGGFTEREFKIFKEKNFPIVSLGNLILKADTAVTVAIGDIVYEYQGRS